MSTAEALKEIQLPDEKTTIYETAVEQLRTSGTLPLLVKKKSKLGSAGYKIWPSTAYPLMVYMVTLDAAEKPYRHSGVELGAMFSFVFLVFRGEEKLKKNGKRVPQIQS